MLTRCPATIPKLAMRQFFKALAIAVLIGGCSDSVTSPPAPSVGSVTLSRDTVTLVPGAFTQLSATAFAVGGGTLDRTATWSSSDETKARVVGGIITGVAIGSATVTATIEGQSASAQVTILDGGVIVPAGGTISALGGALQLTSPASAVTQPLTIFVKAANAPPPDPGLLVGTALELAPSTGTFSQPVMLAIRYGAETIGSEIRSGSLRLYMLVNGGWQEVPGSVVDTTARMVSARIERLGTFAIIGDLRVAQIVVSPPAASLQVGATITFSATLKDALGRTLSGRTVAWSSSDQTVARIDATTGQLFAVSPGSTVIAAASEGKRVTASVTVAAVPVASVEISPVNSSLFSGRSVQLTAVTKDAQGHLLPDRTVRFVSSNSAVVLVTSDGLASALTFGSATIMATSEGASGSVTISVRHDPIVFVHGFQSSGSIWASMTNRFNADGWTDTPLVTWTYDSNQSNAAIAVNLQAKVDSVLSVSGATKVDIIAHSMGGLSARYFTKNLGGSERIDAFVALATPNHGTTQANLCGLVGCLEMRPGSAFLTALNADDETPRSPRYATWWTPCDQFTTPPESVILAGATNTQTACIGHSEMYSDVTVYQQVRDWVK